MVKFSCCLVDKALFEVLCELELEKRGVGVREGEVELERGRGAQCVGVPPIWSDPLDSWNCRE